MKILVFGAGVVGTIYAWQLHEAGADVSLLVRQKRLVRYSHSGVPISFTDMRSGKKSIGQAVFRPQTIDRIDPAKPYDLIIVCVRNNQLPEAIQYIAKQAPKSHLLIMGNLWDADRFIRKFLPPERFSLGFPGLVFGKNTDNGIQCFLFRKEATMLGDPHRQNNPELRKIAEVLELAGMHPRVIRNMTDRLAGRFLQSAILPALISKAGNAVLFGDNKLLIKQYIMALKEGQKVYRRKGKIKFFPFNLFFLPGFLIPFFLRRTFTTEQLAAWDTQQKHATEEKKQLYYHVLNAGKRQKKPMPYWASFEKYMDF